MSPSGVQEVDCVFILVGSYFYFAVIAGFNVKLALGVMNNTPYHFH